MLTTQSRLRLRRGVARPWPSLLLAAHVGHSRRWSSSQAGGTPSRRLSNNHKNDKNIKNNNNNNNKKPSLVEQLFPEESKRYEDEALAQQKPARQIPRLPIDSPSHSPPPPTPTSTFTPTPTSTFTPTPTPTSTFTPTFTPKSPRQDPPAISPSAQQAYDQAAQASPATSVLMLRNASTNLTEEDFRRLIPQSRHIQGWTLDAGDIIKVVPGRDWSTLARQNVYYLLFSSPLSAFTYRGHVTRIHKLAAMYTPTSVTSPLPPPPGYLVEGLDIRSAIQAYSLVPPSQNLELRQLRPPLKPPVRALIKHKGHPSLVGRPDKMPWEVRLTLEGPQLHASAIRHAIMESAKARALSWSGRENINVTVTTWDPDRRVSASKHTDHDAQVTPRAKQVKQDGATRLGEAAGVSEGLKRRTPIPVYIVGFHTEGAAQSFVSHWHRRPLESRGEALYGDCDGDLAPIVNVELLW